MTSQNQISNKIFKNNKVRSYIFQSPNFSEEECQVPERCIYPKWNCKLGAKLRIRILASPIPWVPGGLCHSWYGCFWQIKIQGPETCYKYIPHAHRPGLWHRSFVISLAVTSPSMPSPQATPQHLRNENICCLGEKTVVWYVYLEAIPAELKSLL